MHVVKMQSMGKDGCFGGIDAQAPAGVDVDHVDVKGVILRFTEI